MGVSQPLVLGHSWGTLVAVALALKHPRNIRALILASGYYYPTVRADVLVLSPPALPLVGDVLSHTISPIQSAMADFPSQDFRPQPCPKEVCGLSGRDGYASISDPGRRGRNSAHDSRGLQLPRGLWTSKDARGHRCRQRRSSE
jgi:pimeloyl-ACP methyl ester carboxylesterase